MKDQTVRNVATRHNFWKDQTVHNRPNTQPNQAVLILTCPVPTWEPKKGPKTCKGKKGVSSTILITYLILTSLSWKAKRAPYLWGREKGLVFSLNFSNLVGYLPYPLVPACSTVLGGCTYHTYHSSGNPKWDPIPVGEGKEVSAVRLV